MEQVYQFKTSLKYRKGLWRRIVIMGSQTLADFDRIIREAFNHDLGDHLSECFLGRVWHSEGLGEIEPSGDGSGARKKINQLGLSEGDKLEYVYDFGDSIQHIIILEKIGESEEGVEYPSVISKNRPRHHYCEVCDEQGKKTRATWVCVDCSNYEQREVFVCENCLVEQHEDHFADEILY